MTTTPDNDSISSPQDGPEDFSHPAFQNFNRNDRGAIPNDEIRDMAKALYDDAGLEWDDWVVDPGTAEGNVEGEVEDEGNDEGNKPKSETEPQQQQTQQQQQQIPSTITLNGRQIPNDQAVALASWYDWLSANPDKANDIAKIMQGQQIVPPAPNQVDLSQQQQQSQQQSQQPAQQQVQLPEGFDLDTPKDKFIFEQMNRLAESQNQIAQLTQQQLHLTQQQKVQSDFAAALVQFRGAHPDLSDDDITNIRKSAAELNIVDSLVRQNQSNPVAGIIKALEAGMWNTSDIRDRMYQVRQQQNQQQQADNDRKKKLSALSGSSGSTPRTESKPRLDSDSDMKQAIARAVESAFSQ